MIIDIARKYKPERIYLESNQAQRIFGDTLKAETDLPITLFYTGAQNKHDLAKGIPGVKTMLENKKIRIPRGNKASIALTDLWMNEMGGFTFDGGKVKTVEAHDDLAMAFWICEQAVKAGDGTSFGFGDEKDDDEELPPELNTNIREESPNVILIGYEDIDDEDDDDDYMSDYITKIERMSQKPKNPWEV